jgi:IS30 family transposase
MGRPKLPRRLERAFWRSVRDGLSLHAAARAAGVGQGTAVRWFGKAGGMSPIELDEPSSRYLSLAEREEIVVGIAERVSLREIARRLGRSPSTIVRELERNTDAAGNRSRYRATAAQGYAEARMRRPKRSKLASDPRLCAYVQEKLTCGERWSPEQISHRLPVEFPHDERMRISHEAIYQSLYIQGRGGLRRELTVCLRTGRAIRKPRRSVETRGKRQIPPELMISERPAEIADRAVPGHWEGDLIVGPGSKSAIGTLVERTTRFVLLLHLPTDHGAEAVRDAILTTIVTLPEALRRSLTWDQGTELARHRDIKFAIDLAIYFCDPHSPWQRGTNENTNGLLRQYFPKGTDLSVHGPDELARVAAGLNGRPRKTLGWKTPAEALDELLSSKAF